MPSPYFNHKNKSIIATVKFSIYYGKKIQEGALLIVCTLLLYLEESDFYRYF